MSEVEFSIKETEIQEITQLSKLQGGSKYRQEEIYKLLDRVVARGPVTDPAKLQLMMPATTIICPYCMTKNAFEKYQCVKTCTGCGKGVFRSI
jgi:Zn finger protein HypA/HybF involved in hydrogenase expression